MIGEDLEQDYLQNLRAGNSHDNQDDARESEDGEFDEEAEDECHKLLFFWRMNRPPHASEPLLVTDIFDFGINGCFTKDSKIEWRHFSETDADPTNIESNPIEVEDKWGQRVSPNMYIRISKGGLLT